LHADPLFAIRQQEVSARKQVVQNPAQMLRIRQQVSRGIVAAQVFLTACCAIHMVVYSRPPTAPACSSTA
jgi:hypothetical protein